MYIVAEKGGDKPRHYRRTSVQKVAAGFIPAQYHSRFQLLMVGNTHPTQIMVESTNGECQRQHRIFSLTRLSQKVKLKMNFQGRRA
jgi:hypothetical protein